MPEKMPPGSLAQNITAQINLEAAVVPVLAVRAISIIYVISFVFLTLFYYGIIQVNFLEGMFFLVLLLSHVIINCK